MLLLQELGQHWQMAQAAEPKQQAAVLPSEMMAPMMERETGALGRTDLEMENWYDGMNQQTNCPLHYFRRDLKRLHTVHCDVVSSL